MDVEERGPLQGSGGLAHSPASRVNTMCGGRAAFTVGADLGGRIMVELTHVKVKGGTNEERRFEYGPIFKDCPMFVKGKVGTL
jgi:hypothetical protein